MHSDEIEPFDPATMCHPDPDLSGGDGCPYIEPCKLRCHVRWLDGQIQPNDPWADRERMTPQGD